MRNLRFATLALVALFMSALLAACSGPSSGGLDPGSTEGTFALDVVVQGQGTVTIDDFDFECSNECTARIGAEVTVVLRAQGQGETGFAGWQGACTGTGTCTVTMDSDKAVTAVFANNVLMLEMQGDGQASVRVEPGDDCAGSCVRAYDSPVNVSLLVEPNDGSVAEGFGGACSDSDRDDFCLIEVRGRVDVTVNVNLVRYRLTVDFTGNGSVTGAGIDCPGDCSEEVTGGSRVTLRADPDDGWEFTRWTGGCSGTEPTCTVEMDGAREVTAIFDRETFPLAATVVGDGSGSITGPGISCPDDCDETYDEGTDVTLTARPELGSTFEGWGGACSGTSATCDVTMDSAKEVTARFEPAVVPPPPEEFTLNVDVGGEGSGQVTGPGISCPGDCDETYDEGTDVTLTAAPAGGSTFEGWSGDCSGRSTTCNVTMNSDQNVSATFAPEAPPPPEEFTLNVDVTGEGSGQVTGPGISCPGNCNETYDEGTDVTLTAAPADGSTFEGWGGDCSGTNTACDITIDSDQDVTATFEPEAPPPPEEFALNVDLTGDGGGAVTGAGIDCEPDCDETYEEGTEVTLTANPDGDSTFGGWGGACSGTDTSCDVTMDSNENVTAQFDPVPADVQHRLDVMVEGEGSGSVSGDGISCPGDCDESYDEGTPVTLTAAPGSDSEFDSWAGCDSADNENCTVNMTEPKQVTATFSPLEATFTLALQFSGDGSGSVIIDPSEAGSCSQECTETYAGGTDVTLTADPDDDSIFTNWSGDCTGDSGPCQLTMDGDRNVTVNFDIDSTNDGGDSEDDDVQTTG